MECRVSRSAIPRLMDLRIPPPSRLRAPPKIGLLPTPPPIRICDNRYNQPPDEINNGNRKMNHPNRQRNRPTEDQHSSHPQFTTMVTLFNVITRLLIALENWQSSFPSKLGTVLKNFTDNIRPPRRSSTLTESLATLTHHYKQDISSAVTDDIKRTTTNQLNLIRGITANSKDWHLAATTARKQLLRSHHHINAGKLHSFHKVILDLISNTDTSVESVFLPHRPLTSHQSNQVIETTSSSSSPSPPSPPPPPPLLSTLPTSTPRIPQRPIPRESTTLSSLSPMTSAPLLPLPPPPPSSQGHLRTSYPNSHCGGNVTLYDIICNSTSAHDDSTSDPTPSLLPMNSSPSPSSDSSSIAEETTLTLSTHPTDTGSDKPRTTSGNNTTSSHPIVHQNDINLYRIRPFYPSHKNTWRISSEEEPFDTLIIADSNGKRWMDAPTNWLVYAFSGMKLQDVANIMKKSPSIARFKRIIIHCGRNDSFESVKYNIESFVDFLKGYTGPPITIIPSLPDPGLDETGLHLFRTIISEEFENAAVIFNQPHLYERLRPRDYKHYSRSTAKYLIDSIIQHLNYY